MKFFIETYGCTSNQGNSREAEAALVQLGHIPSTLKEADALIVNTCAVTEKTERKITRRLRELEGDRLIIAGCLSAALPESVDKISCRKRMGILCKSSALEIAEGFPLGISTPLLMSAAQDNACAIINIAEGCLGRCGYCIVKNARGELASRDPEEVVEAAALLIRSGAVELELTAQDTAAWGLDIGSSLPKLLARIARIPGRFMVRVGMMTPNFAKLIIKDLANEFHNPKIYKFLHMPVQSGSNSVLERMGREYFVEDYIEIVRNLRETLPEMCFATDVIAGFPGETEEDFAKTMQLIEMTRPDKVNVTKYSQRPGTRAAKLYDMPDRIKKERSRTLTRRWMDIAGKNNKRYLGMALEVLVTERGRAKTMKARTENYTGAVIKGLPPLGVFQKILITGANPFYITGVVPPLA